MIRVQKLSFTYAGKAQPAVRELNFDVQQGEIFGFLGPSGAGKSTTQKVLTGLLKDYHGLVTIFDRDLKQWGADLYEEIGVSFELPNHFLKLTGFENLNYFRRLYAVPTRQPQELLELVGLDADGRLPVEQYSKGMKNRLTVARALLHNPPLLFLDEPTAGLDPVNARRMKDLILNQRQAGATIFLTTHDMAVADELCDRVALIVAGEIKVIDTPHALKLQYGRKQVQIEYGNGSGSRQRREFNLEGLGDQPEFLALLRTGQVQTIHSQEATLEDVFIQVTGRSLA